jgi:hypothetical protein
LCRAGSSCRRIWLDRTGALRRAAEQVDLEAAQDLVEVGFRERGGLVWVVHRRNDEQERGHRMAAIRRGHAVAYRSAWQPSKRSRLHFVRRRGAWWGRRRPPCDDRVMRFALAILVLACSSAAFADTRLKCEMSGTYDDKDAFAFPAEYIAKPTGDKFSGIYTNPAAGTSATVGGAVTKGTWSIQFVYTDEKHRNQMTNLAGTGTLDAKANTVSITGKFQITVKGKPIKSGTFKLNGKCKAA